MSEKTKIRVGHLNDVGGVLTELQRVYREMRRDQIDGAQGERLVRTLVAIRQTIENSDVERRLAELEAKVR